MAARRSRARRHNRRNEKQVEEAARDIHAGFLLMTSDRCAYRGWLQIVSTWVHDVFLKQRIWRVGHKILIQGVSSFIGTFGRLLRYHRFSHPCNERHHLSLIFFLVSNEVAQMFAIVAIVALLMARTTRLSYVRP
jgi:hypothetical protein